MLSGGIFSSSFRRWELFIQSFKFKFMKNVILLAVFSLIVGIGCAPNEELEPVEIEDFRKEFLIGKSKTQIMFDYQALSVFEKKKLWLDKIHFALNGEVTPEQKRIIEEILEELEMVEKADDFLSDKMRKLGRRLAQRMTMEDFIGTFATLYDYKIRNEVGDVCQEYIDSLEDEFFISRGASRLNSEDEPPCNCKWTCGGLLGPDVDCTTSNCEETSSGCGWFWSQSCEERDVLLDTNDECPN